MNTSPSRILQEEMTKFHDLTHESLVIQTVDYEEYKGKIGQIFKRVERATRSFQVLALIFIYTYVLLFVPSSKWRTASRKRQT